MRTRVHARRVRSCAFVCVTYCGYEEVERIRGYRVSFRVRLRLAASALLCSRHETLRKRLKKKEEEEEQQGREGRTRERKRRDDDDDDEEEMEERRISLAPEERGENHRGGTGLRVEIVLPCPATTCGESAFLPGYFSSFLPSSLPSFLPSFLPSCAFFPLQPHLLLFFIIDSSFVRPYSFFFYFPPVPF